VVDYTTIRTVLQKIEGEYNKYMVSSDIHMPQLLSKLATMEFCGWIEESIDEILHNYLDSHIVDLQVKNNIKDFVKDIHGLSFDKHIYKIFPLVIGANNWENVLDALSIADRNNFRTIANTYHKQRNSAAHVNTIIGVTSSYNAPSQVLLDFNKIESAIKIIESQVANLRQ
jgi:hypothetical protein